MGYENTLKAFDESLKNLGLDYLNLYLVHMPFGDYYGSWRAMEELYKSGKVRAIGVCNFLPDRLADLCFNADIIPHVNQIERHPHYQRQEELELMRETWGAASGLGSFRRGFERDVFRACHFRHRRKAQHDAGSGNTALERPARRHRHTKISPQGAHGRKS